MQLSVSPMGTKILHDSIQSVHTRLDDLFFSVERHPPGEHIDWDVLPIYDEYTEDGWLIPRDRKPPTPELSCDKNKSSLIEVCRSLADCELSVDPFLWTSQKENNLKGVVSFWCSTFKGYAYHGKGNISAWKSQFFARPYSCQNLQEQEKNTVQKIIIHFKIRGRIFSNLENLTQDDFIRIYDEQPSDSRTNLFCPGGNDGGPKGPIVEPGAQVSD